MLSKALTGAAVATALGSLAFATPALAATSARATTPHCTNAMLKASYAYSDSGAGHRFGWIRLTNRTSHNCVTGGYGGVSYVGHGNGTQIGHAAIRTSGKVASYVLKPGQRLLSPINEVNAEIYSPSQCRHVHVDGFRVYVPNATKSQYVVHRTTGCANGGVHLISQRPYRR